MDAEYERIIASVQEHPLCREGNDEWISQYLKDVAISLSQIKNSSAVLVPEKIVMIGELLDRMTQQMVKRGLLYVSP